MSLFGGTIEEWKEATLVIVDTAMQRFQEKVQTLEASEFGGIDTILGKVFNTVNGASIQIAHPALRNPITVTFRLPEAKP